MGAALDRRLAADGWDTSASSRTPAEAARLSSLGVQPVDIADPEVLAKALAQTDAILVTAPPGPQGCPGLSALVPALARANAFPSWIGYLSTTGVYGDRGGRWVFEHSPLAAKSLEGARRAAAERDWLQVGRGMGLTVTVFRLPGIYGPGRSALDRVREGKARRIAAPGQVFSRIHVDDLTAALVASIARPRPGGIYNICDDEPAPNPDVIAYAAELLGMAAPREIPLADAGLTAAGQRFYAESKRVSNALAKAELGWRPRYPTYREGLTAILEAQRQMLPPEGELSRSD